MNTIKAFISGIIIILATVFAVSLVPSTAFAANTQYVFDDTGILTQEQITNLNQRGANIEQNYGVVVIFAYENTDTDLSTVEDQYMYDFLLEHAPQCIQNNTPCCLFLVSPVSRSYKTGVWDKTNMFDDNSATNLTYHATGNALYDLNNDKWSDAPFDYYNDAAFTIPQILQPGNSQPSNSTSAPNSGNTSSSSSNYSQTVPPTSTTSPSNTSPQNTNNTNSMALQWQEGIGGIHIVGKVDALSSNAYNESEKRLEELFDQKQYNVVFYYVLDEEASDFDTDDEMKALIASLDDSFDFGGPTGRDYPCMVIVLNTHNEHVYFQGWNLDLISPEHYTDFVDAYTYVIAHEEPGRSDSWDKATKDLTDLSYQLVEHPEQAKTIAKGLTPDDNSMISVNFHLTPVALIVFIIFMIVIAILIIFVILKTRNKKNLSSQTATQQKPMPNQPYYNNMQPGSAPYPSNQYPPQSPYMPLQQQQYPPSQPSGGYSQQLAQQYPQPQQGYQPSQQMPAATPQQGQSYQQPIQPATEQRPHPPSPFDFSVK